MCADYPLSFSLSHTRTHTHTHTHTYTHIRSHSAQSSESLVIVEEVKISKHLSESEEGWVEREREGRVGE